MATVQSYNRQVQETATPNARVNDQAPVEAFGGGQAAQQANQAIQGFTSEIHRAAEEEKKKADTTVVQEKWTEIVAIKNDLTYNGAMKRKGKDAANVAEEYGVEFDKQADALEASLTSQDQKDMFKHIKSRERGEFVDKLQKHAFGEQEQFADETAQATVKTGKDEAVLNYMDQAKVEQSIGLVSATIMEQAHRKGWSPETTKLHLDAEVSSTRAAIVARHLDNGDDLSAKKYFEVNKDQFTGQDVAHLEKALEEGSLRGESQRLSDSIANKHMSLMGAISEVKKIEDPKVRDATMDRVKAEFALKEQAKREWEENAFKNATNLVEKGGLESIPPSQWAGFSLSTRSALKNYAKGDAQMTDMPTYYDLKTQAATPELQNKFLQTNLLDLSNKFSRGDLKEMMDLQASLRSKDGKADKVLDGFLSDKEIAENTLDQIGIKSSDKDERALFMRRLQEEVVKVEKQTQKKPDSKEVQAISDKLAMKVVTDKGFFFNSRKRVYELSEGEDVKIEIKQVPREEQNKIREALKNKQRKSGRNESITDDMIADLYAQKIKADSRGN